MPDKTKTVVVIESHEQTIIRHSRRTASGQLLMDWAEARPLGRATPDAPGAGVLAKPKGRWWLAVALKGVNVCSQWLRRLKRGRSERRHE